MRSKRFARGSFLSAALAVIFANALFITPSNASAEDVALKWKFKPNDTLKLKFDQKNDSETKAMGQSADNLSELKFNLTWTVKDVKDGVAQINQVIDDVEAHIQAPGVNIDFNSKDKNDPEDQVGKSVADIYRVAIGVPFVLSVKENGEITKVDIPQKVVDAVAKSPFRAIADSGSIFSEKGIKVLFAQILPVLPEKGVGSGAKLDANKLLVPAGPFSMDLSYKPTVSKADANEVTIVDDISTKLIVPDNSPLDIKLTKETGTRSYSFNPTDGILTKSSLKQSFDLALSVNNNNIDQTIAIEVSLAVSKP